MNKSAIWTIVGVLVGSGLLLVFLAVLGSGGNPGTSAIGSEAPPVTSADNIWGDPSAKVTVIEYVDFQCPACGVWAPAMKQLRSEYGDRVLFVARNFPLRGVHQNAEITARATQAAALQNKYWEMHELLFENQQDWDRTATGRMLDEKLVPYAATLGLDVERFRRDIESDEVKNKVRSDTDGGEASRVDHTPTFFLNGKQIANPRNLDEFKSLINGALAS